MITTEHVPRPLPELAVVHSEPSEKVTSPLVVNLTSAPPTRLWLTELSFTVTVAIEVVAPEDGSVLTTGVDNASVTWAGAANSARGAEPEWPLLSALMFSKPRASGLVGAVMVIEQVPSAGPLVAVVQVPGAGMLA